MQTAVAMHARHPSLNTLNHALGISGSDGLFHAPLYDCKNDLLLLSSSEGTLWFNLEMLRGLCVRRME